MYVLTGNLAGRKLVFPLDKTTLYVGRGSKNDIDLDHSSVSRTHAEITIVDDRITVRDLKSANHTRVNGKVLKAFVPVSLQIRDEILFASVKLRLYPEDIEDMSGEIMEASDSGPIPPVVLADALLASPESVEEQEALSWDEITSDITPTPDAYPDLIRVLISLGKLIVRPQPLDEVLEHLLVQLERVIEARRILIVMTDTPDGSPVVRAARPPVESTSNKAVLSSTIIAKVLNEREALLLNDAQKNPDFADQKSVIGLNIRSAMVAPLFDNREVIGLLYADHDSPTFQYNTSDLRIFTLLANLIAVKISNARLLELEADTKAARQVQLNLLPARLPEVPGCDVAARMIPCTEVAGDLYDVRKLPDGRFAIVVGDVTGHGLPAAMLATHVVGGLDMILDENPSLVLLVERLHRQILNRTDDTHFVTFFFGVYDPATGRLDYFNAGHNPPQVMLPDDRYVTLDPTGQPLGLMHDAPSHDIRTFDLPEQSMLCIFSDGIPEALVATEVYGVERLLQSARQRCHQDLEEVIDGVFDDLRAFLRNEPLADDATLLLLRRCPEAAESTE